MSVTPKTDALFFPFGRDATAAAEPSLLVCMTQYELLERENAALRGENTTLRDQLKPCWEQFDRLMVEIVALREQSKAQLAELHRISEALGTTEGHSSVTHIEILREKLKKYQKDAERYRWIDEHGLTELLVALEKNPRSLDETIDTAMKEKRK